MLPLMRQVVISLMPNNLPSPPLPLPPHGGTTPLLFSLFLHTVVPPLSPSPSSSTRWYSTEKGYEKKVTATPRVLRNLAVKTRKLWSLYSLSVADSQSLVQCLRHKRASTVRRSLLHLIFYYALPSCCRRVTGRGYVKSGFQLPDEKEAEAKWGTTTMNWWNRLKAAILRWFQVKGINYTKLCCKVARRAGLDISVLSKFWQILRRKEGLH